MKDIYIDPKSYNIDRRWYLEKHDGGLVRYTPATELVETLVKIIALCPNPQLPYGKQVVELAKAAIKKHEEEQ